MFANIVLLQVMYSTFWTHFHFLRCFDNTLFSLLNSCGGGGGGGRVGHADRRGPVRDKGRWNWEGGGGGKGIGDERERGRGRDGWR